MTALPSRPTIYHITHVDNLPQIIASGGIVSDRALLDQGGPPRTIGMSSIKRRRVEELEVSCHPGTKVGDYVPFYFCPRSIMLFVIHCANKPELTYRGGQGPIIHLEADLFDVVAWANANSRRWAFSLSNAGAYYATFRCDLAQLNELDWTAITATDFRSPAVKEGKQAEFLVADSFPFGCVRRIGVRSDAIRESAERALSGAAHRPVVEVKPDWYF